VTADEISGVLAANAVIMPSKPPDKRKRILSFSMLPPKMKLDIVIKTKHKKNMNIADTMVINTSFYVYLDSSALCGIFVLARIVLNDIFYKVQMRLANSLGDRPEIGKP
jgi:uncharacterized protein with PQ loop repeat